MTRRPMVAIALLAVVVLAGCTVGYQPGVSDRSEPPTEGELGYYDGYRYDDTFDIDPTNGLTERETEAVVSRAMARVQLLRGLRFEEDVEVEIISREAFREEYDDVWREPSDDVRALDNAQHEALFLVGSDEDVVDVRRGNRGGTVLGFYQPSTEQLVIVSGNDPATLDDELTLAHELVHAVQDQRFDLGSIESSTLDGTNARNGLIEGDASLVESVYERNCETGEWQCVETDTSSGSALSPDFHWGVYFLSFFPYAEGPTFIDHHRDAGGWDAVDRMYDDRPRTSAEIIRPASYRTDAYGNATVRDRHGGGWERVRLENGSDAASVGRAGGASMFAYTAYAGDSPGVIDREEFRNAGSDGLDSTRPYTYDVPYTEGWYGDRLHAYERNGETAHVWNVTFNDAENATAFVDGYGQVAAHWGGERAGGTVWTFEETDRFGGAVWVERDGNAVTVVKAPSEAALAEVYAPVGSMSANAARGPVTAD
ncbi:MAG: Hvo_1808 family surface protein [Halobacteriota archaeon]|uniref:Hvo_1808 family surface protein n=1 Tax=Natronomonas sp. TaxID=2184060 RepID=UPI00397655A8